MFAWANGLSTFISHCAELATPCAYFRAISSWLRGDHDIVNAGLTCINFAGAAIP
jgi:hypothetical protein